MPTSDNNHNVSSLLLEDEIIIRDEQGKFKIFKNGKLVPEEELKKRAEGRSDKKTEPQKSVMPQAKVEEAKNGAKAMFENAANELILERGISFESEERKNKFVNYLVTYLRDLRAKKEMLYLLTIPKESEGLGLSMEQANKIVSMLDLKKQELGKNYSEIVKNVKPEKAVEINKDAGSEKIEISGDKDLKSAPEISATKIVPEARPVLEKPEIKISKPMFIPQKTQEDLNLKAQEEIALVKPALDEQKEKAKELLRKQAMAQEVNFAPAIAISKPKETAQPKEGALMGQFRKPLSERISPQRPLVTDIKFPAQEAGLVGPVEEIGRINLIDFRRMGQRFKEIVVEKIELLGEENFGNKIKGITAWKQSQVYRLYLTLALEALIRNVSLDDIIIEWQKQGQQALTRTEFEEINSFNKVLNF